MNKNVLRACMLPAVMVAAIAAVPGARGATDLSQTPIAVGGSVPPLNMIVLGRDHKLYYEAYNDASDLDGDGKLDVRFDTTITYYGYFDSTLCYSYSSGIYTPAARVSGGVCGGKWHGNFLNYLTTARIDALRKVLYGGKRHIDTAERTVLERTHIPQDAHSWGKEYASIANDGYDIRDYTPLGLPTSGKRHLFANVTPSGTDEPPLLRVLESSGYRIWEWVSIERLVAGSECDDGKSWRQSCGTITDYHVRVEVCTADFHDNDCRLYPAGNYKPAGLIQQYGEDDSMMFGLISGSYAKNKSGGVLRKPVSSVASEIDLQDGTFETAADSLGLIATINGLRTKGFGWDTYDCGWVTTRPINDGECRMWGNPIGEMMYEGLRYFAGKATPTSDFDITASDEDDKSLGLPLATWDDPYEYSPDAGTGFPWCAKPFMLVISDLNVSYDSDQLPGSAFGTFSGDLAGLNVQSEAATLTAGETDVTGSRFVGEVDGTTSDNAPTPKAVSSLGKVRGLPEEPTKQGSYYSAAVAHFGKTNDLHDAKGKQSTDTFVVALSSPLPKIEMPIGSGSSARTVTLVPFAKSVSGGGIDGSPGKFQPTNQIVDFYVKEIVNTNSGNRDSTVNGGRPYGKFSINFEDVEQGADHDMDAIVDYEVKVNADNTLTVSLDSIYSASGIQQHIGYVISGTTRDGIYLDVVAKQHSGSPYKYSLDTPAGCWPESDGTIPETTECQAALGLTATRTFTAGSSTAGYLKDPLWYAAKWGGFNDLNKNGRLDSTEWDADRDGTPDSYFLVTNPLKLRGQLEKLFSDIVERSSSGSAVSLSGSWQRGDMTVYQGRFFTGDWSGHLDALPVDDDGNLGEANWDAATQLDKIEPSARTVLTWDPDEKEGVPFRWDDLTASQQAQLFVTPETESVGQARLEYLRGERAREEGNAGGVFRTRSTVLGDIVNSSPQYVGAPQLVLPEADFEGYAKFKSDNKSRKPLVYVGANDGMLHGFDAKTGDELLAFVPNAVFGNLGKLTDPEYSHRAFVDGSIAVGDIKADGTWKSILVGGLGAGGKSLFALDVTDPSRFAEDNADELVKWEVTVGNVLAKPQIVYLNNGKWGVITGGGYNGGSPAALYVLDADTGEELKRIDVAAAAGKESFTDNGIGPVEVIDEDGDFTADTVYGGDLYGNVWKFDISNGSTGSWSVAYSTQGQPAPMYVARGPTGLRQPITTKPAVLRHPLGKGYLVYVGTGRYLGASDVSVTDVQTLHAVWDTGTHLAGLDRSVMLEQSILFDNTDKFGIADMRVTSALPITWFSSKSGNDLPATPATDGYMGWYLDLDSANDVGERIHQNPFIRNNRLVAVSVTPDSDPCTGGGSSWIYEIDAFSGSRLDQTPFDYNGDGSFDSADTLSREEAADGGATADSAGNTIGSGIRQGEGIYYMNEDSVRANDAERKEVKFPATGKGEVLTINESVGPGMWRTWTEITR